MADKVTSVIGSWYGFLTQITFICCWIIYNSLPTTNHIDSFPFILLNLALSTQAALSVSLILMSQNKQAVIDRRNIEDSLITELESSLMLREIIDRLERMKNETPRQDPPESPM